MTHLLTLLGIFLVSAIAGFLINHLFFCIRMQAGNRAFEAKHKALLADLETPKHWPPEWQPGQMDNWKLESIQALHGMFPRIDLPKEDDK